ncbi:MAG: response regulator [Desulfobacterales bacterium]|nr:response regulator [Desulfobacterales bacterium]
MPRFRAMSIKRKLTGGIMLTSGIALFITAAAFIANDLVSLQRSIKKEMSTLAKVIGTNCTAALIFDDRESAEETLSALGAVPHILAAHVYTIDGAFFSGYRAEPEDMEAPRARLPGAIRPRDYYGNLPALVKKNRGRFHGGRLDLFEPILLDREIVGIVGLQSDLRNFHARVRWYGMGCVIILLFATMISYFLSSCLRRVILGPILSLARTMDTVTREKNYTIREEKRSDDEIGALIEGFNKMLAEIQERDQALRFTQFSIDHGGDAVLWIDPDARFFLVNQAARRTLGYSREELQSMALSDIDPDFSRGAWMEEWERVKKYGSITLEAVFRKKNGKTCPVEISVNYLEFEGRECCCAFARDVAERKEMERQLQQAEKMKAVGALAAGVAHDLNNILGGVASYPEMLIMNLPPDSPLRKPLTTIQKSGRKAADIVEDMLTLSRRSVAVKEVVDLGAVISEYLGSPEFEKLAAFHPGVTVHTRIEEAPLTIEASPSHLSQTVMNLVSNAAEAMPSGGELHVSAENRRLKRSVEGYESVEAGEYVVLTVSDSGIGISSRGLKKIFEPFYTKKVMGRSGTGLGMSVVWSTVKDHDGYIDVESVEGVGTTFRLYFPFTTRRVTTSSGGRFSIDDYLGEGRILVIDDVREQREIASGMLTNLGYDVTAVSGGEEAAVYMETHSADLLILDMIMSPGMDGLETYKKILEMHPGQKAIIASGFSETERVRGARALGAGAYIKKPYTLEKLARAVKEELAGGAV